MRSQQLRHSNPEIRQSLGFFSPLFPAPSLCLASLAPDHPQKRRKMVVLGAAPRHVLPTFSKRRSHFRSCYLSQAFEDRHCMKRELLFDMQYTARLFGTCVLETAVSWGRYLDATGASALDERFEARILEREARIL